MFRAVDGFIRANPLRSNIISATLVSSCGDGMAQLLEQRRGGGEEKGEDEEEGKTAYDASRTARVGLQTECGRPEAALSKPRSELSVHGSLS